MSATVLDPAPPSSQIKSQYTGGQCVYTGGETLGAANFKDFCTAYLQKPIPVMITRARYLGLPKKTTGGKDGVPYVEGQDTWKKKIPFFTSGFAPNPPTRKKETMRQCSLVSLDIDDHCEARRLAEGDYIADSLPYNYFAYRTISSTPGRPRLRIVVDAETFPMESYEAAVRYLCDLLGVKANTETLDCSRPMFRPTVFQLPGDTLSGFESPPTLSFRVDGLPMPPVTPAVPTPAEDDSLPSMAGMHPQGAPRKGVGPKSVAQMLERISPNVDRGDWMNVLCGIKHQFADDPETGFEVFHDWSKKCTRANAYVSEEEDRKTWDSFRAIPGDRNPVTIGKVIWMAKQGGWVPPKVSPDDEDNAAAAVQRITEAITAAETLFDLVPTLLRVIAREKSLGSVERAILIEAVQTRLRSHFRHRVGLPELKREVNRVMEEEAREARAGSDLPAPLVGWAFVSSLNKMVKMASPQNCIDVAAFNMQLTDQFEFLRDNDNPGLTPAILARDHPQFPKVDRVGYAPDKPTERFYEDEGDRLLNTYRDTRPALDPDPDNVAKAGKLLLEHTRNMFPDEDNTSNLLSWMAYQVQNPGKKVKWAVFMQGVPGCGKSFYADFMMAVHGMSNVSFIDRNMLESNYNDWMFGAQLLVLDEVAMGEDRKKIMEILKPLVTQDRLGKSQKYMSSSPNERNIANLLLLSNNRDGITIDATDRRYFILRSAFQTREQVKALPDDYFVKLYKLTTELAGAGRQFLLNYKLRDDFDPSTAAPLNDDRESVVEAGISATGFALKEVLDTAEGPLLRNDVLALDALFVALRGIPAGKTLTARAVAMNLTDRLGFTKFGQVRIGGKKETIYFHSSFSHPALSAGEVARDRFDEAQTAGFPGE